jgi:hypothetical protein
MAKDTSKAAYDKHAGALRAAGKSKAQVERETNREFRNRQTAAEREYLDGKDGKR